MNNQEIRKVSLVLQLLFVVFGLTLMVVLVIPFIVMGKLDYHDIIPKSQLQIAQEVDYFSGNFDVSKLGDANQDKVIKYGYELIVNTSKHIGPNVPKAEMRYAGNNLACKSCHLEAGTKKYAAPYIGVTKRYPQYRAREGKEGTIQERINGCMERSMNGKKLPEESKEMQAMVAYMNWLSRDIPEEIAKKYLIGTGFKEFEFPNRAVDRIHGQEVYDRSCKSCHQADGQGVMVEGGSSYVYPPLWGEDSYNHAAGMHRVITAAQFIKINMPFGASEENIILTDEEAYDVAGFINSLSRPMKNNTDMDFPDKKLKPVSTSYPPYADQFSQEQHKYGPFPEIIEFYRKEYGINKKK